jgi:putative hydrolase of the HAD superfamily
MALTPQITTLFIDIGGVLLSNGWDHHSRQLAAETFQLDFAELDERHHLIYDTYEEGKLSLDEYLDRVVFCQERPFTKEDFRTFIFNQSQPYNNMLAYFREIKSHNKLKILAVSNEGSELTKFRIQKFNLEEIIDTFVSSCFVHFRKPDPDIYRIALDISQSKPEQVIYIDDRQMFVEVARDLGIQGIVHSSLQSTREALKDVRIG